MLERAVVASQSDTLRRQGAFGGGLAQQAAAGLVALAHGLTPPSEHSAAHSEYPLWQVEVEPVAWHWPRWRKDSRRCCPGNWYAGGTRSGSGSLAR